MTGRSDESRAGKPIFDFRSGWAWAESAKSNAAHWYDAGDGNALRSACGGHIVAIQMPFEPGGFHRCLRCRRVLARKRERAL
jgi:hypothetical protein